MLSGETELCTGSCQAVTLQSAKIRSGKVAQLFWCSQFLPSALQSAQLFTQDEKQDKFNKEKLECKKSDQILKRDKKPQIRHQ